MPGSPIVWDASCLLTLLATERPGEILTSLGCPSYVVEQVRLGEVRYLRPLPERDPLGTLLPADPAPLLAAGLLQDTRLDPTEQALFVEYAREIDDGEAMTGAVAVSRGFRMATDDRGAIRCLRSLPSPPPILTTPDWLSEWESAASIGADLLRETLRKVALCARYRPHRTHPMFGWWTSHLPPP